MSQLKWYAIFMIQVIGTGIVMAIIEQVMGWEPHFTMTHATIAVLVARLGMHEVEVKHERS